MNEKVRPVLFDDLLERRNYVRSMLEFDNQLELVAELGNTEDNLSQLESLAPNVSIIVVDIENADNTQLVEQLSLQYPRVATIVLSQHKDWHFVRQYMRAGARDYLYLPVEPEVLARTIIEVNRMNEAVHQSAVPSSLSIQQKHLSARIITFCSRKGGVGKTTLTINFAAALAVRGKRVVLVNFAQSTTMFNEMFDLNLIHGLGDLMDHHAVGQQIEQCLAFNDKSGLFILSFLDNTWEPNRWMPEFIQPILSALQDKFEYIVIDTASVVDDFWLEIVRQSTDSWLVSNLNTISVKDNSALVQYIAEKSHESPFKTIINCVGRDNIYTTEVARQAFNTDILCELSFDIELVETSMKQHLPFVLCSPERPLSRQINELAGNVIGSSQQ